MTVKEIFIQIALGSLTDKMKRELASSPGTPVKVLTTLSKDKNWSVRCRVANNTNTTKKVLTKLSKDKDASVRLSAAHNPGLPVWPSFKIQFIQILMDY